MKKITTTILASTLVASSLLATGATVTAVKVDSDLSKVSYNSAVWKKVAFSPVILYPQTTIKMNDKKANEVNAANSAKKAIVAAIYNNNDIAFMIKWLDDTMNIRKTNSTTSYSDGFAIQFAGDFSDPKKLPYIGMGSEGRPVAIYIQKAEKEVFEPNGNGDVWHQVNRNQTHLFGKDLAKFDKEVKALESNDYQRSFVSEGFRSMTEIKDGSSQSYMRISYKGKRWEGTLSRSMKDDYVNLDAGAIPVAFAVWDGEKMGRDGLKHLSGWISVKLEDKEGGDALIAALDDKLIGDAKAGKEAAITNGCVGCHQIEVTDAPNLMGPALMNIGGYSTAAYLKESLLKPSAAIVPGYNRNAHSNSQWYTQENGKRTSTMADFSWLDEKTQNDIVAYLQTLKAEVK